MHVYILSSDNCKPCIVLKWPEVCLMFDCGLDVKTLLSFEPLRPVATEKRIRLSVGSTTVWKPSSVMVNPILSLVDCCGQVFVSGLPEFLPAEEHLFNFADIDAVFISNHTTMLGLPYITEREGFRGKVYATDPTLQFGRLLMEELVEYVERATIDSADPRWKEPDVCRQFPNTPVSNAKDWRPLYSADDLRRCLAKVEIVAFRENRDIHGFAKVTALSSAYSIGSCNWIVETDYDRIAYVAGSSIFKTHPRPIEPLTLRNADALIITSLSQVAEVDPDQMTNDFLNSVSNTVQAGGNVLIPCYPTGTIYDLFEKLALFLDSRALSNIPMFFVSPVANSTLAYANIYAEWLAEAKQYKVYLPEEPFPHGYLLKNGRLKHFTAIYDGLSSEFRTPCIVFAGHPSLRLGDAVYFMDLWASDPKNAVIIVEPDFSSADVLGPFQPLAMRAIFCPIDTSLSFAQASGILADLKPKRLLVPADYTKSPSHSLNRPDLMLQCNVAPTTFRRSQILSVQFPRNFAKVSMSSKLAMDLELSKAVGNLSIGSVVGYLSAAGNRYELKALREATPPPAATDGKKTPPQPAMPQPYGAIDAVALHKCFTRAGFEATLEAKEDGTNVITFAKDKAEIRLNGQRTQIFVDSTDRNRGEIRRKIRDMLLQNVSVI